MSHPLFPESGSFSRTVQTSTANVLCLLLRVTVAPTSNASLNNVSRSSNLADYNIVPVARSYAGYEWEKVAGPYAQDLTVACSSNSCNVNIPSLPNLDEGKFFLMSFEFNLSDRETVSRFFLQATFGPTLAMINSWNYGTSTLNSMTSWVQNQILSTDPTYHREYFRERVDGPLGVSKSDEDRDHERSRRTHHPCDKSATWLRYSFRFEDSLKELVVSQVSSGLLLSIDGVPRTVVSRWQRYDNNQNLGTGTYALNCQDWESKVNGVLRVRRASGGGCIRIRDGNPPINIPFTSNLVNVIDLPALSGPTKNVYLPRFYNSLGGEAYYLSSGFSSSQCNLLSPFEYNNLIGTTPGGDQYIYGGFILLNENSLESPKSDGGGDFITPGGDEYCANPAMSFTNSESSVNFLVLYTHSYV